MLCTNAQIQRAEPKDSASLWENKTQETENISYRYRIWYKRAKSLTYCFLKHVMGQIFIALTLWVIFRMPSSHIYKYREIMRDIYDMYYMIRWSDRERKYSLSFLCFLNLCRRRVRANNMMICYIDIIRIRADRQGTFVQFWYIFATFFGYFV